MQRYGFAIVLGVLAAVTVACGLAGWWLLLAQAAPDHPPAARAVEAFFRALRAFTVSDIYNNAPESPAYDERASVRWLLETARWTGLAVTATALWRLLGRIFRESFKSWSAANRKGHAIVWGDHPLARRFAELCAARRTRVTHYSSAVETEWDSVLTLARPQDALASRLKSSFKGANRIVIAEADDAATAQTALEISRTFHTTPVFAVIRDSWLAGRLNHVSDIAAAPKASAGRRRGAARAVGPADLLSVVSEGGGAARAVLNVHPPFLLAQKAGSPRVHVVISGFGDLGAAIAGHLLNANVFADAPWPMITVLDPDGGARRAGFAARHPGLLERLDLEVIAQNADALDEAAIARLQARAAETPIAAAYMTEKAGAPPFVAGVAFKDLAERQDLLSGPIFISARDGAGLKPQPGGVVFEPRQLVAFGGWDAIIEANGLLDPSPDERARAYHAAYRDPERTDDRNRPWEQLREMYRVSNRRAVAHIPAKLHAAGFDLEPWLKTGPLSPNALPAVRPGERLFRNATEWVALAALEHERWTVDRLLEGWRAGAPRDDVKRYHPDLKPFEALADGTKKYDLEFVAALQDWLETAPDGLARRSDAAAPPDERPEDRALVTAQLGARAEALLA